MKRCKGCEPDTLTSALKHRITIEQLSRTKDGAGGWSEVWTTFASVYAGIEPYFGLVQTEVFEQQQIQTDVKHKIRTGYRAGVTNDMRVVFKGRIFRILNTINVKEESKELNILCQEVADPR